jgi:hypothetical protein
MTSEIARAAGAITQAAATSRGTTSLDGNDIERFLGRAAGR